MATIRPTFDAKGELDPRSSDSDDIESILRMDAEIAAEEHLLATAEFFRICSLVGAKPDEIEEASRKRKIAAESLETALRRFSDFINFGKVPSDL